MLTKQSDFSSLLQSLQGKRVLHLGHKDADCDALGSAYAVSCLLPGDIGFAHGLKASAHDLADWLQFTPIFDPDPSEYEYTLIYDTPSPELLAIEVPTVYALFDHHTSGIRHYIDYRNKLAEGAKWCWLRPVESTCSLLVDLFTEYNIAISHTMGVALAAGIVTDTSLLRRIKADGLRRLATVLEASNMSFEDVLAVIDGGHRKAIRRDAVLAAIQNVQEIKIGPWCILVTATDTHDHGFAVIEALGHLGADIRITAFPAREATIAIVDCDASVIQRTGIDLYKLITEVGQVIHATETWGWAMRANIVASLPVQQLLGLCIEAVGQALKSTTTVEL